MTKDTDPVPSLVVSSTGVCRATKTITVSINRLSSRPVMAGRSTTQTLRDRPIALFYGMKTSLPVLNVFHLSVDDITPMRIADVLWFTSCVFRQSCRGRTSAAPVCR